MKTSIHAALTAAVLGVSSIASAAALTPGNLAIYRVGDGAAALSNTGVAAFVDEYTPAGVLVQSIALPTLTSGLNVAAIANGTATSEGFLTMSADGSSLVMAGYNRPLGGTGVVSSTSSVDVPRSIVRVGLDGSITSRGFNIHSAGNIRGVASTDGDNFWTVGSNQGVFAGSLSSGTAANISPAFGATNVTNTRTIQISEGNLVLSLAQGTLPRIGSIAGTPTAGPTSFAGLPGLTFPANNSPYAVLFLDRSDTIPGVDTLYYVDDGAQTNGLYKFSFDGTDWIARGQLALANARGIAGVVSGDNASLFITNGTTLQGFVDTAAWNANLSGSFVQLAAAGTNTAFRGIAVIPEPAALGLLAPLALTLLRRR